MGAEEETRTEERGATVDQDRDKVEESGVKGVEGKETWDY